MLEKIESTPVKIIIFCKLSKIVVFIVPDKPRPIVPISAEWAFYFAV
ncbi:MAG: hypothetical protein WBB23_17090 [Desulforhopalus sp.]